MHLYNSLKYTTKLKSFKIKYEKKLTNYKYFVKWVVKTKLNNKEKYKRKKKWKKLKEIGKFKFCVFFMIHIFIRLGYNVFNGYFLFTVYINRILFKIQYYGVKINELLKHLSGICKN